MKTDHALERIQQRCIPATVLDLIAEYGKPVKAKQHGTIFMMDRRSRAALAADLGAAEYSAIQSKLSACVLEADGVVVTTYWRNRRVYRDFRRHRRGRYVQGQ